MKIGFLGAGNMGSAIIKGLLKSNEVSNSNIKIVINSDASYQKWDALGISVSKEWNSLQECDVIILALLPNTIIKLQEELNKVFKNKIIVSVASGLTLNHLRKIFPSCSITRTMPNTSCEFNKSMTMITTDGHDDANQVATMIFNFCGATIMLLEKDIHLFIAICGSASAYLYHWLQPFVTLAKQYQVEEQNTRKIISGLLEGVASNIAHSDESLQQLQDNVTSPGGTTYEAIKVFDHNDVQTTIMKALLACLNKSISLEE